MASWKKIITSGSAAELSSLALDTALPVAQGGIGATSLTDKAVLISQDSGTDAVGSLALTTNGSIIVGGTNGPAVEAADDVAGTGLTAAVGDGTLAINLDATHTAITSIKHNSLIIGGNSQNNTIDFGTDDTILFDIDNTEVAKVEADGVTITGNISSSAEISASTFYGDGSNLTGVSQDIDSLTELDATPHQTEDEFLISDNGTEKRISMANVAKGVFAAADDGDDATIAADGGITINNDAVTTDKILDANVTLAKIANAAANTVIVRDANSSGVLSAKAVTNTQILIGDGTGFTAASLSGDVTMTNAGVVTIENDAVEQAMIADNAVGNAQMADDAIGNAELKQDEDITLQSLTLTGDLTVNGTTTTIATANTLVEDKFMFLATGSAASNTDGGIVVQSGSVDLSGSAFYHDTNSQRWAVAKSVGQSDVSIVPTNFVATVSSSTSNPTNNNNHDENYGTGEMVVNTSTGEIWIRT